MARDCPAGDEPSPPSPDWDARHRAALAQGPPDDAPHPFLLEVADQLPATGAALAIAAGLGRNAFWLARRGLALLAIDASQVACDHIAARARKERLPIATLCRDLEQAPLLRGPYDLVVNTLYLQRNLAPQIEAVLAPGGLLLFVTMVEGGTGPPPVHKEYVLNRGELPALFPTLDPILFREDPSDAERPLAHLLARKPA